MARETEWLTIAQAADRLGLTRQGLGQWLEGRHHESIRLHRGKREFAWPAFPRWREQTMRDEAVARARPEDYEAAKARKMAADAELAELELARRRGELCAVADFEAALETAFSRVRTRLLNLPAKSSPHLVGLRSITEAQGALEPFVEEVVAELRGEEAVDAVA